MIFSLSSGRTLQIAKRKSNVLEAPDFDPGDLLVKGQILWSGFDPGGDVGVA